MRKDRRKRKRRGEKGMGDEDGQKEPSRERTETETHLPQRERKSPIPFPTVGNDSGDEHEARGSERQRLVDGAPGTSKAGPPAGTPVGVRMQ